MGPAKIHLERNTNLLPNESTSSTILRFSTRNQTSQMAIVLSITVNMTERVSLCMINSFLIIFFTNLSLDVPSLFISLITIIPPTCGLAYFKHKKDQPKMTQEKRSKTSNVHGTYKQNWLLPPCMVL